MVVAALAVAGTFGNHAIQNNPKYLRAECVHVCEMNRQLEWNYVVYLFVCVKKLMLCTARWDRVCECVCVCVCTKRELEREWESMRLMLAVKFARRQFMCWICVWISEQLSLPKLMPLGRNFIEIILLFVYVAFSSHTYILKSHHNRNQYVLRTRNLFLASHIEQIRQREEKKKHTREIRSNRARKTERAGGKRVEYTPF